MSSEQQQQQQQQQYGGAYQYPQYGFPQQQYQAPPSYPQYSAPPQQSYAVAAPAGGADYQGGYRQAIQDITANRQSIWGQVGLTAMNAALFLGLPLYLFYRMSKGGPLGGGGSKTISQMMEQMNPVQKRNFRMEVKNVKFEDVIGVPEAKAEVKQYVDFLRAPDRFSTLGARLPRGALLTGKPGTGKTLLAKAVAGEADVPFFSCSGADFIEIFGGSGPKRVRELFAAAKEASPAVIFIDELDSVGSKRSSMGDQGIGGEENRTTNALLAEMDGMGTNDGVIVLAATNFPEHLDTALTRPGRFDRKIEIPVPDETARKELFEYYLNKITTSVSFDKKAAELKKKVADAKAEVERKRNAPDVAEKKKRLAEHRAEMDKLHADEGAKNKETREKDLAMKIRQLQKEVGEQEVFEPNFDPPTEEDKAEGAKLAAELAARTPGVTPASIATIANESALVAAERGGSFVKGSDINDAIDNVLIGKKHRSRMSDHGLKRTSYHEAGHTVAQWFSGTQTHVIKVSVIPRGKAGGYTQFRQREELDPQTDTFLYEQLMVLLAGRNAERLFFGDFSTGAHDDLQRAFKAAKSQVQHYGMNKDFGPMAIDPQGEQRGRGASHMSEALLAKVEQQAKLIVEKADADCLAMLKKHRAKMEELAAKIYETKELNEEQIQAILGDKVETPSPEVRPATA
eukprot:Hpha_TRINITY_DN16998_c2_g4::TRINITY_DN16998_c2_g4_i1::g.56259::m.56259/K03798/ftsH, hflB; cell division protease FtsH